MWQKLEAFGQRRNLTAYAVPRAPRPRGQGLEGPPPHLSLDFCSKWFCPECSRGVWVTPRLTAFELPGGRRGADGGLVGDGTAWPSAWTAVVIMGWNYQAVRTSHPCPCLCSCHITGRARSWLLELSLVTRTLLEAHPPLAQPLPSPPSCLSQEAPGQLAEGIRAPGEEPGLLSVPSSCPTGLPPRRSFSFRP